MQGSHGLLDVRVSIEPVTLEHVDVVRLQPLEGCVDCIEDGSTRESVLVDVVLVCVVSDVVGLDLERFSDRIKALQDRTSTSAVTILSSGSSSSAAHANGDSTDLCEDDQLVTRQIVLFDCLCDDLLALAVAIWKCRTVLRH